MRCDVDGIPKDSLYLVTVRLATFKPFSLRISEILLSESGFLGGSLEIISLICVTCIIELNIDLLVLFNINNELPKSKDGSNITGVAVRPITFDGLICLINLSITPPLVHL